MKYDLKWALDAEANGIVLKYLYFWGHRKGKNDEVSASCMSQWYEATFVVDGISYPTAEHWMMSRKALLFDDHPTFEKIIKSKTPGEAKDLGRKVLNFDENLWNEKRFEIVVRGNLAKFTQNKNLGLFLINTSNRILVEASPVDKIWGVGLASDNEQIQNPNTWKGLNLLGFSLMEVRDLLKNN